MGKKPLWELWAEAEAEKQHAADRLLKAGAFTAQDFARKTGWTLEKCRKYLSKLELKTEVANDPRCHHNPKTRFFFPPKD